MPEPSSAHKVAAPSKRAAAWESSFIGTPAVLCRRGDRIGLGGIGPGFDSDALINDAKLCRFDYDSIHTCPAAGDGQLALAVGLIPSLKISARRPGFQIATRS